MREIVDLDKKTLAGQRFEVHKLADLLNEAYMKGGREPSDRPKKSFAPSGVGYGSGTCFTADTEFVTDLGIRRMGDVVGQSVNVWTGSGRWGQGRDRSWSKSRGWKPATVEYFGEHETYDIIIERHGVYKKITTTAQHRWIVETSAYNVSRNRESPKRAITTELQPGWRLWRDGRVFRSPELSKDGIRAGIVYGDGSVDAGKTSSYVVLHGGKDLELLHLFSDYSISDEFLHRGDDSEHMVNNHLPCRKVYGMPRSYKATPDLTESAGYLFGWLAGYFAADGNIHSSGAASITSHKRESIEAVRDVCAILGIDTGTILHSVRNKLGKDYDVYTITISFRSVGPELFLLSHHREYYDAMVAHESRSAPRWSVVSVTKTGRVEPVYCVVEPETERFALADGILTMNCPRQWFYSFTGGVFREEQNDAMGIANMAYGVDAHTRIQKVFEDTEILVEAERKVDTTDSDEFPPILGYADLIINWQGEDVVGEIKTTMQESYISKKSKSTPAGYHLLQVLIYMKVLGLNKGFLLYENKNTQKLLIVPVVWNVANKKLVDETFEWMQKVYDNWKAGTKPNRPFKSDRSVACKSCPFTKHCWEDEEDGVVDLPTLVVPK